MIFVKEVLPGKPQANQNKMRTRIIYLLAILLISSICRADTLVTPERIPAPDGSSVLVISNDIRLVDSAGSSLVALARNLEGVQRVDAKWSSDSQLVIVVISYGRGSGVEAVYFAQGSWHKTLQPDADLPVEELARQAGVSGRLVAQHCDLGDWLDPRRIAVTGDFVFSGQKRVAYGYTLIFTGGPTHLDRGGFEEGALEGTGYHLK